MNKSFLAMENSFSLLFDFGFNLDIVVDLHFGGLAKDKTFP